MIYKLILVSMMINFDFIAYILKNIKFYYKIIKT